MLSIQPQLTTNTHFTSTKKEIASSPQEAKRNSGAINKTLLALAAIGMSTLLTSCYKDDYYGIEEPNNPEQAFVENKQTTNTISNTIINTNAYERTTNILNTLGLLTNDSTALEDVETISFRDNNRCRYSLKPTSVYDRQICGRGIKIGSDNSAVEQYSFIIKNADNGSINFIKNLDSGKTETLNYKVNNDSTVVESEVIDNNYMLEKSVFTKKEDGTIERKFTDGSTVIYNNIKNDEPYPTPIMFDAGVAGWENGN